MASHEARTAHARRDLYRFFAGLFLRPPEEESVRQLLGPETLDKLSGAYGEEAVGNLRPILSSVETVRSEYDRLFRVPGDGFVPAYESVYRDRGPDEGDRGRLYGPSCRAVMALMKEAGAELPRDLGVPPDHIGVEFLYLSFLCDQEGMTRSAGQPDRLERWLGRERRFLEDHPARWFPLLAARIRDSVPGGFYAALVRLVEGVIDTELRLLEAGDA